MSIKMIEEISLLEFFSSCIAVETSPVTKRKSIKDDEFNKTHSNLTWRIRMGWVVEVVQRVPMIQTHPA